MTIRISHRTAAALLAASMLCITASSFVIVAMATSAVAQAPGQGTPPVVGVAVATEREINETAEFNGRIEAPDEVNIIARVSAFLDEQLFVDGSDVKKGDLLFRLERAPYEADVEAKSAAVAQAEAQLDNANIAFERADQLRKTGSGSQSTLDNAIATQKTSVAQLRSAQAALHASQISLDYTEIHSPISGRIGRASMTVGNVVSASSGTLVKVVSQDPMYVTFPVPTRKLIEMQQKHSAIGGASKALRLRIRLPDGRIYDQAGTLDFVDASVASDTDSITVRGSISNPARVNEQRELFNNEFVRVVVEEITPAKVLAIPRVAVLTDQQGSYVYHVDDQNVAKIRRVKIGQSTADTATIMEGLAVGDRVIVEGIQRVRSNMPVTPETSDAK
ncbi:efflux RND transporter periplasmic adaptor subunit [Agrobacterium leguminum]|uniref:efflux RND transporter periplasmic adaptor subunit n=1 Tax=Agrobacterium leguminum TaxID=2792015 RepID=UPI00272C5995|nr:efflux RND transporter periplasmic adaptor subunit [Agrobacterium leguminum]WLD96326.1 efflux RND transporter periplasmic adaptor subunit [Agrobacterium leguminum]